MDFNILISFVVATFTLAFSPGPDNIFVLIQSATYGKKSGMAVVFGLMTGCLIHTTLVAFGLSSFLQSNETMYTFLKLFGAGYMVFLAYQIFQSNNLLETHSALTNKKSLTQLFSQGFVMNVLNPKVSIFFLAFFPAFLFSDTLSLFEQFYVLGFIFIITSFIVFSSLVVLSGFFSKLLIDSPVRTKRLKMLQMVVFIGLAIIILWG